MKQLLDVAAAYEVAFNEWGDLSDRGPTIHKKLKRRFLYLFEDLLVIARPYGATSYQAIRRYPTAEIKIEPTGEGFLSSFFVHYSTPFSSFSHLL